MKQKMRKPRKRRAPNTKRKIYLRLLKCALIGCVLTIIMVLALALLLKWNVFPESGISIATSCIKVISAVLAGLLAASAATQKGWLMGGVSGTLYILLAFIAFSLVEKVFSVNWGLLADISMGFAAGAGGGLLPKLKGE